MKSIQTAALLVLIASASAAHAASPRTQNNRGVRAYEKEDYARASEYFNKAADTAPEDMRIRYNRGATQLRMGQTEKAADDIESAAEARDAEVARRAQYAAGVLRYNEALEKAEENPQEALNLARQAVEMNRSVLRQDLADNDARVNYELSMRLQKQIEELLQQQQQQQQDQEKQDQQKEQQEQQQDGQQQQEEREQQEEQQEQQEEQQEQQEQDQRPEDSEQQEESGKRPEEGESRPEEEKSEPQKAEQDERGAEEPQDATESMLNLLDDNDTEAIKRMLQRRYGDLPRPDKDW